MMGRVNDESTAVKGNLDVARRVFFSFHYQLDHWRVQQVLNMGSVEGQPFLSSQEWEDVAKNGDAAIERWIDEQMKGKSCNVVLIGSRTAGRRWVEYEICKAWDEGKGVVGVYIHGLRNEDGEVGYQGSNPFANISLSNGETLDHYVRAINPFGSTSNEVYSTIRNNLEQWVENAIADRR